MQLPAILPLPWNYQNEVLKQWKAWYREGGALLWVIEGP